MVYSRTNSKMGKRRMRKSFSKKNKSRKNGGCGCKTRRMRKPRRMRGGCHTTEMPELNKPIYDYVTSRSPYTN